MLTSHILLVQEQLKDLLTGDTIKRLRDLVESSGGAEPTDSKMVDFLEDLTANFAAPIPTLLQTPLRDQQPSKRKSKLTDEFCSFLNSLKVNSNLAEVIRRCLCPVCEHAPVEAHITSCMHIYCEACLPVSEEGGGVECKECEVKVTKTEYCRSIDALDQPSPSPFLAQGRLPGSRSEKRKPREPKARKNRAAARDVGLTTPDWIARAGHEMHGAKLAATRSQIRGWFAESSEIKVLIFTQFLDMGRILGMMCESENWGFTAVRANLLERMEHTNIPQAQRHDAHTRKRGGHEEVQGGFGYEDSNIFPTCWRNRFRPELCK
jgi:hypothetical protein